jgi:Flp pilus assembly secretin CpaC
MRSSGKIIATALIAVLFGCSNQPVPPAHPTTGRSPTVAEVPGSEETVRGAEDPPIVTLEVSSHLRERRLSRSEDLPGNIIVPNTNLDAVPVTAALQAVLAGTDVSLSWSTGSFDDRLVSVSNLSGSLPRVVDKICSAAKVFCSYRHGLLEIREKETFIIELPAMPMKGSSSSSSSSSSSASSAGNTMAEAISDLAGDKAKMDQQGGNLIFTSDVDGYERVHEYLDQLRNGRPLVVMQLYIWEVTLNKENGSGVNWSSFNLRNIGTTAENTLVSGSTGFSSFTNPGVSLGAAFAGHVTADAVFQFLATQGQVQTISNPQLTFVSGSSAEFRVGGKQRYISQVGTLQSSVSTSTTTNSTTNTVSTDSLETGLSVNINGNYENGIISAVLELALQDVVSLNPTTTQGLTIDLPQTSERKVASTLRVRPGDNLVLAGLVSSRDTNNREGIPLFDSRLDTYNDDQYQNSELVILVKPSIVLFSDARAKEQEKRQSAEGASKAMPDAVVIDKDGTKKLKMPASAAVSSEPLAPVSQPVAQPVALAPSPAQPELMMSSPNAEPLRDTPVSVGADEAPVDKRLLQRGFSHAYDDMLGSDGATGSTGGGP